jgi:hypothetical protein
MVVSTGASVTTVFSTTRHKNEIHYVVFNAFYSFLQRYPSYSTVQSVTKATTGRATDELTENVDVARAVRVAIAVGRVTRHDHEVGRTVRTGPTDADQRQD